MSSYYNEEGDIKLLFDVILKFLLNGSFLDILGSIDLNPSKSLPTNIPLILSSCGEALILLASILALFPDDTNSFNIRIRESVVGSSLCTILVQLGSREIIPRKFRKLCWDCVELLLVLYRDETIVTLENSIYSSESSRNNFDDVIPLHKRMNCEDGTRNVGHEYLKTIEGFVRLLRPPDSMLDSGCLISTLKIFLLVLESKVINESESSDNLWLNYTWLLRYLHDRRGIVRTLAISIMELVLDLNRYGEDSIRRFVTDHGSETNEPEISTSKKTISILMLDSPLSNVRHALMDGSESMSVRIVALRIFSRYFRCLCCVLIKSSSIDKEGPRTLLKSILSAILCCVTACLNSNIENQRLDSLSAYTDSYAAVSYNSACAREGLNALETILSGVGKASNLACSGVYIDILQICSELKLFKPIINYINPECFRNLVSVLNGRFSGGFSEYYFSDIAVNAQDKKLDGIKWEFYEHPIGQMLSIQNSILKEDFAHFSVAQTKAIRFFQRLTEIEENIRKNGGIFVSWLNQCLQHTNLFQNVLSSIIALKKMDSNLLRINSLVTVQSHSFICSIDFLSMLIARDDSYESSPGSSFFRISELIKNNSPIQANLSLYIADKILKIVDELKEGIDSWINATEQLTSCLRLLMLMLNSVSWRRGMCLGTPFKVSEGYSFNSNNDPPVALLNSLLNIKSTCTDIIIESTEAKYKSIILISIGQIDVVLGLLLQYSGGLRELYAEVSVAGDLVQRHDLSVAVDALQKITKDLSRSPMRDRTKDSACESLKLLKNKITDGKSTQFFTPPRPLRLNATVVSPNSITISPTDLSRSKSASRINCSASGSTEKTWYDFIDS